MSDNPNHIAASRLADLGIAVFPCATDKRPRPGVRWKEEATTDQARIASWWRRWPDSLPAFEPGRHMLVAIDCDRHGKGDGVAALEEIALANDDDPRDWPTVETPSTGRHVFFQQDGSLTNARGTLPAGIDVRGTGGYVIAEGATLPDGRDYHPVADGLIVALECGSLPHLPSWLAGILAAKPEAPVVPAVLAVVPQPISRAVSVPSAVDKPSDFYDRVKQAAMARLDAWVPTLFPGSTFQPGTGAYRVSSRELGRDLQEDLSIHPEGIKDWGVADMGDLRGGNRTAIDLVQDYGGAPDALSAARWLCDRLGINFDALWAETRSEPNIDFSMLKARPRPAADAGQPALHPEADPVDIWGKFNPPELPTGLLPATIEEFARVQGEMMGADPGGLACAALAVCAAAIPDSIKLQVKQHDTSWTESARLWIALIGDPSTKKSPVLSQAVRPLLRLDAALYREYAQAMAEYEALPKEERASAHKPRQVRLRIEDTTIEAAQEVLRDSPEGVLCLQDELSGWFGSMDKYAGARGGAKDRSFWLQSFNGGSYAINRISRGAGFIENLSVSMLGGIQPEPMRKIAGESVDDGLLQRLFPIVLRSATLGDDKPAPDATGRYDLLVQSLHRLKSPRARPAHLAPEAPVPLMFDQGAQRIRRELEQRHLDLMSIEIINKKLAAHIGKFDGLFARLCLLWHCIENADAAALPSIVTEDIAARVAEFLHRFLLRHSVAFYAGVLGLSDDHERITAVAGYILAHKLDVVTNRDVQRGDRTMRNIERYAIQRILEQLEALGWLTQTPARRPTDPPHWRVNPVVHTLFADRAKREAERRRVAHSIVADIADEAA